MSHPVQFLKSAEEEYSNLPLPFQNDILAKVRLLKEFPYTGAAMDNAYQGYRSVVACRGQYRVIYQVKESGVVEIVYIRHCRRQLGLRLVT